jgi:hypothetical protein
MRIISIAGLCVMTMLASPAVSNANQLYAKENRILTAYQRQHGTLAWQEIVSSGMTPDEICGAVKRQVAYRDDVGDARKTGKDTWTDGYGDCEDIASCVAELCAESGHEASVLAIYRNSDKKGHAVVVGRWNGHMWMSSNGSYELVNSADEAKKNIADTLLDCRPADVTMVSLETVKKARDNPRGEDSSLKDVVLGVGEPESAPDYPRSSGFHMVVHFRVGGSAR